jgi:hypothetical protein
MQFYFDESGEFRLVAQGIDKKRCCIKSPLIFLVAADKKMSLKINFPVILGQFELSDNQIKKFSNNGELDLIFTATDKFKINPVAVSYDVNGNPVNPCPPAIPPN